MKHLIDKSIIMDKEEWIVEEITKDARMFVCRRIFSTETQYVPVALVENLVKTFEEDSKELSKNKNAITFKENEEKELLKKIITYYNNNFDASMLTTEESYIFSKIKETIFI